MTEQVSSVTPDAVFCVLVCSSPIVVVVVFVDFVCVRIAVSMRLCIAAWDVVCIR